MVTTVTEALVAQSQRRITATPETLMEQASETAHRYLLEARKSVDLVFGEGYAKSHPELVGSCVVAASIDMAGATIGQQVRFIADAIEEKIL